MDEQNAEVENRTMLNSPGIVLVANDYDNHAAHMKVHREFRKSRMIQRLKEQDMQAYLVFDITIQNHEAFHLKYLQEQMAQNEKVVNMQEKRR
jgi:hypothetical protein